MKTYSPLLILFIFIICSSTVASATSTVSITPSSKILVVGDTFTITLFVTPDQYVDTVGIDLISWNKNVLECLSVERGNLFPDPLVWIKGKINNTAGTIEWMAVASNIPINTAGIFCNITFKVKASGISTITIVEFGVARNGSDIPHQILNSCQITVEGSTPTPPPPVPPLPPPGNNSCCNNETIEPGNETIPPDNNQTTPSDNETYVPIGNSTQNDTTPTNQTTNDENPLPPNSQETSQEPIATMTIIYILAIIIISSIIAYALVHHYRNKQEEENEEDIDELDLFGETDDDETSGGNKL